MEIDSEILSPIKDGPLAASTLPASAASLDFQQKQSNPCSCITPSPKRLLPELLEGETPDEKPPAKPCLEVKADDAKGPNKGGDLDVSLSQVYTSRMEQMEIKREAEAASAAAKAKPGLGKGKKNRGRGRGRGRGGRGSRKRDKEAEEDPDTDNEVCPEASSSADIARIPRTAKPKDSEGPKTRKYKKSKTDDFHVKPCGDGAWFDPEDWFNDANAWWWWRAQVQTQDCEMDATVDNHEAVQVQDANMEEDGAHDCDEEAIEQKSEDEETPAKEVSFARRPPPKGNVAYERWSCIKEAFQIHVGGLVAYPSKYQD